MADVYEQNLPQKTNLTTNDYVRVVGSDDVSYKQPLSDVAQKTIENYAGSTLAGSTQSVKGAIDGLKSSATADKAELNASINEVASDLANESSTRASQDTNLQAQINQLVAPTGTAPNPAEIENARIGADNVTYTTLGDAIRTQVTDLKSEITALNDSVFSMAEISPITFTAGAYYAETGELRYHADYGYSDLIPIEPNTKYYVYNAVEAQFLCYYNSSNEYIRGDILTTNKIFTTPINASFVRVSAHKTDFSTIGIGTIAPNTIYGKKAYEATEALTDSVFSTAEISPIAFTTGAYYAETGEYRVNPDYGYSDLFPIEPDTEYYIYNPHDYAFLCFYNSEKAYISGAIVPNSFVTPSGASYMRYSTHKTNIFTVGIGKTPQGINFGKFAFDAIEEIPKVFHVGQGYEYTTLRSGVAEAVKYHNSKVYVHSGTYDLATEFASEIAYHSGSGIELKNGVEIIFDAGAYVTCILPASDRWVYVNFEPFKVKGSFILDGANIVASNTRYCVHDEMEGSGTYCSKYINCNMKYINEWSDSPYYVQCIGGGLGEHGTIEIVGGVYETETAFGTEWLDASNYQNPISYHNGYSASADSRISIRGVYLKNRGYFRFGDYGASNIMSLVELSDCSVGLATKHRFETQDSHTNFDVIEFNINVRNSGTDHWRVSWE